MNEQVTPSSILIQYRGTPAALVNARQLSFLGEVRHLPPGNPIVKVVAHMGYYAQLVLSGRMPGPYTDGDAERFARLALIDEGELALLGGATDAELAARFGVPIEEVVKARREIEGPDGR
jgi:hypothetical protein